MATYRRNFPWLLHHAPGLTQQSYGSVNNQSPRDIEPSIMEGVSTDGKMSNTRRFFIMLTVFDVLFTFLIWIICTIVSGEYTIGTAFKNEVLSYSIKSSMFDVVVLAVARLFLIILFYVFIRLSHWWVVAVTTAGTSAFVIAKVFLYQWVHSSKTAAVVLLLCSFVISWGEAWFLDFRVLPIEYRAESILEIQAQQEVVRHPMVFPFPHPPLSRSQSEDGSAFYSPQGSDTDDALYDDTGALSDIEWLSPRSSHNLETEYKKLAEDGLQKALDIIESDGWKKEKVEGGDTIFTKVIPIYGKVFKFVGTLHMSPDEVIDELYFKGEEMHKWNPTVKKVRIIQRIDDNVDIAHVIATEGAAGLVASRDFVNLRIWKKQDSEYLHGTVGTTHPDVPVSKYVRGEQGPGAYIITPGTTSDSCKLQWLLNTNLKGWIPQYLIDQTLSSVMMDYIQALRRHCAKNKASV